MWMLVDWLGFLPLKKRAEVYNMRVYMCCINSGITQWILMYLHIGHPPEPVLRQVKELFILGTPKRVRLMKLLGLLLQWVWETSSTRFEENWQGLSSFGMMIWGTPGPWYHSFQETSSFSLLRAKNTLCNGWKFRFMIGLKYLKPSWSSMVSIGILLHYISNFLR